MSNTFEDVEQLGLLEDETKEEEVSPEESGGGGVEAKYDDWKAALSEMESIVEAADDAMCKPCESVWDVCVWFGTF